MAHTKAVSGWYDYCDGRVRQLQLVPHIIAVYSTMTLQYIVKDHITKETYYGWGVSRRNVREQCYNKALELARSHEPGVMK